MNEPYKHDSLVRLLDAAQKAGVHGPAALAKALNESDQVVTNWGRRGVSKPGAMSAEKKLGVSAVWIISGTGAPFPDPASVVAQGMSPAPLPGGPAIHVPLLANAGSMGRGNDVQHEDVHVGSIALSPEWVTRRVQPTNASALRFIHAYGDSMQPTFSDGDVLLVDTGMRDPSQADGVYVLSTSQRLFIKRVSGRFDGGFDVSSDNPTVKTIGSLDGGQQISVLGRVVWAWNGKKL